jgi:hypothetical protein
LVDPRDQNELEQIHSLQDAIKVIQQNPGTFQIPNWDEANRRKVQLALLQLGTTVSDTRRMYGINVENRLTSVAPPNAPVLAFLDASFGLSAL